jgi:predicted metal-binding membrane protein
MSTCVKVASSGSRMSDTALEAVLRRDRAIVLAALVAIAAIAWAYVLWLARDMSISTLLVPVGQGRAMPGMDMKGIDMSAMPSMDMAPIFTAWGPIDFALMFTMWSVMMVGMMTPSVAPMVLLYAGVGRKARASGGVFASSAWFFLGYLLVWIGFSIAATGTQWILTSVALLSPMMTTTSTALSGVVLLVAGLYQWTSWKDVCLRQCQAPIAFLSKNGGFRSDPYGAAGVGVKHGLYCLGCCWALMGLLFVGGIMNLFWIAGIAILVLSEKVMPLGRVIPRIAGAIMGLAGIWLITEAFPR